MTQYSLFGADASALTLADLDGLLLAGGQWVRTSAGARLSVLVAEQWRADELAAAFVALDVAGPDPVVTAASGLGVRTGFHPELEPHAARWTRGARQGLPAGFRLDAGGLRMWAVAAGRGDDNGYLLATGTDEDPVHRAAGAQLARLGVTAAALGPRGGPGWRVTSTRRLRRLVELLGPPPPGAGPGWPTPGRGPGHPADAEPGRPTPGAGSDHPTGTRPDRLSGTDHGHSPASTATPLPMFLPRPLPGPDDRPAGESADS